MALFLSAMLATTDSSFHYGPARRPSQCHLWLDLLGKVSSCLFPRKRKNNFLFLTINEFQLPRDAKYKLSSVWWFSKRSPNVWGNQWVLNSQLNLNCSNKKSWLTITTRRCAEVFSSVYLHHHQLHECGRRIAADLNIWPAPSLCLGCVPISNFLRRIFYSNQWRCQLFFSSASAFA